MNNILNIKLSQIHGCYLRKEFGSAIGPVKLTRDNPIGRFIAATVEWGKQKPEVDEHHTQLSIPDSRYMEQEWFFCYLSPERDKWVRDFIQAYFDITIEIFFVKGYRQGYRQKDIALSFINYYNLPDTLATYEMIIKRDFRKRKNIKRIIADNIIRS